MLWGRTHRYRVTTDPGNRPRNFPSSRANMPSGVSASLVTQTILVSALVYCAGSSTKSNTSSGVTASATVVPSPLIMAGPPLHLAPRVTRRQPSAAFQSPRKVMGLEVIAMVIGQLGPGLQADDERDARRLSDGSVQVLMSTSRMGPVTRGGAFRCWRA